MSLLFLFFSAIIFSIIIYVYTLGLIIVKMTESENQCNEDVICIICSVTVLRGFAQ